jgi:hypothetical protein
MIDTTHYDYLQVIDSTRLLTDTTPRAAFLQHGLGAVPLQQRVRLYGDRQLRGNAGFLVRRQAKRLNPQAGNREPKYLIEHGAALLDSASGAILYAERVNARLPKVNDTLHAEDWHFGRTLWDWYGEWMLYLADDFIYERQESHPVVGTISTTLRVRGRDTIGVWECYVVDYHRGLPERPGLDRRFWIDVDQRVTVRVCDGGYCLQRVLPRTDSTAAVGADSPPESPLGMPNEEEN